MIQSLFTRGLSAAGLLAAMTLSGAAMAGPMSGGQTTSMCVDVDGESKPILCEGPASRLDKTDDICICHVGQKVTVPVCGPRERPPAENRAFERARLAMSRDGTLVGDRYRGQRICVAKPRG